MSENINDFIKMVPENAEVEITEDLLKGMVICASFKDELIYPFLLKLLCVQHPVLQSFDLTGLSRMDITGSECINYLEVVRKFIKSNDNYFHQIKTKIKVSTVMKLINDKDLSGQDILLYLLLNNGFNRVFKFSDLLIDNIRGVQHQPASVAILRDLRHAIGSNRVKHAFRKLERVGYISEMKCTCPVHGDYPEIGPKLYRVNPECQIEQDANRRKIDRPNYFADKDKVKDKEWRSVDRVPSSCEASTHCYH